jgi:hypothetical protein
MNHIPQGTLATSDKDFKKNMDYLQLRQRVNDLSDQGEFVTVSLGVTTQPIPMRKVWRDG